MTFIKACPKFGFFFGKLQKVIGHLVTDFKIQIWNKKSKDFYFVRHKGLYIFFRFELGQGDNLGADLQAHGHDGVHGVDVEEGKHGDGHFLNGVGLVRRAKHGHAYKERGLLG